MASEERRAQWRASSARYLATHREKVLEYRRKYGAERKLNFLTWRKDRLRRRELRARDLALYLGV